MDTRNKICPVCNEGDDMYLRCHRRDCSDGRGLLDPPVSSLDSGWMPISWVGRINFPTEAGVVLMRKTNGGLAKDGSPFYHFSLAHKTVSGMWLTETGQPCGNFEEWCEIPK